MEAEPPGRNTSAFQSRDFRLYQIARLLVILGAEAQSVAVAWQVYELTHSALSLGNTGLALFLPGIFFMLPAAAAAIGVGIADVRHTGKHRSKAALLLGLGAGQRQRAHCPAVERAQKGNHVLAAGVITRQL